MGHISTEAYAQDVASAEAFLRGDTQLVLTTLEQRMTSHAEKLEFEQAAELRNQMSAISRVLHQQSIEIASDKDVDIPAVKVQGGKACVNLAMVRGGRHLGDRPYFPVHVEDASLMQHGELDNDEGEGAPPSPIRSRCRCSRPSSRSTTSTCRCRPRWCSAKPWAAN